MQLGTFGAIISFALALEEQAVEFYKRHYETVFSQIDTQFLKSMEKRLSRLSRIRQELVTEMILEPITGVDGSNYDLPLSDTFAETDLVHQAIKVEENLHNFYSTTAPLIPMKEVQRAFLRLAKENESRISSLKDRIP
jgi:rubrerythrin